jgi:uncharacterized protein (DUF924 family)
MSPSGDVDGRYTGWVAEVLKFWFSEVAREQWFAGDEVLDQQVRARFLPIHRMVAVEPEDALLVDPKTALAAVLVLDQFSRNMFRGTESALANDAKALSIAERAIDKGFPTRSTAMSGSSSIYHSSIKRVQLPCYGALNSFQRRLNF